MGQYYKAILLNNKTQRPVGFVVSYDFGNGAKLMEHSWMLNDFVGFVESQLKDNPQRVVWAGDYADEEPVSSLTKKELNILKEAINNEPYYIKDEYKRKEALKHLEENGVNLYELVNDLGVTKLSHNLDLKPGEQYNTDFSRFNLGVQATRFLVNHTKNEFIDKYKTAECGDGWKIHPLPLMTCEGNGRGGGDYRGESPLVGAWARDIISVSSTKPNGFKEIIFDLTE